MAIKEVERASMLVLHLTGPISGLREEFEALQDPSHDNLQLINAEQKHLDAIEDNWRIKPKNLLPVELQPKKKALRLEKWEQGEEFLKAREKWARYFDWKEEKEPELKNPLDWGMSLLAHLALLSDYTVDQGDIAAKTLEHAIYRRIHVKWARKMKELMEEDVISVIEDLIWDDEEMNFD
ncbi:hypothetical protein CC78DRAFT_583047 [Lojkania enalia]|uniref:Uncharacterized protein n=1 Tax=Lojkania enalia TaxID=147567 RepID=A0A9P4N1V5_9PLEO|nr:hypothetical protein CC78DRAFT_583047 [Didymosphaeria enalia]